VSTRLLLGEFRCPDVEAIRRVEQRLRRVAELILEPLVITPALQVHHREGMAVLMQRGVRQPEYLGGFMMLRKRVLLGELWEQRRVGRERLAVLGDDAPSPRLGHLHIATSRTGLVSSTSRSTSHFAKTESAAR
jgi:hypothetical protein